MTLKERDAERQLIELRRTTIEVEKFMNMHEFLPEGWSAVEEKHRTQPHKKQVTFRVDEDVLKFFRNMGSGYQARINAVLRLYMLARVSKTVETWDEMEPDW
ncbi:MAG: BrnA antitoxin family protein [Rhodobacteraceae bacterium]|nr:BrnA antitoxin family protein [Paracoccaceae bacterium]